MSEKIWLQSEFEVLRIVRSNESDCITIRLLAQIVNSHNSSFLGGSSTKDSPQETVAVLSRFMKKGKHCYSGSVGVPCVSYMYLC